jgi:hypothetical protein
LFWKKWILSNRRNSRARLNRRFEDASKGAWNGVLVMRKEETVM